MCYGFQAVTASPVVSSEEAIECCLDGVMGHGKLQKKESSSPETQQKEVVDEFEPEEVTMDYQDFSDRTRSSYGKVGLLVFFMIELLRGQSRCSERMFRDSRRRCSALEEDSVPKDIAPLLPMSTSCVIQIDESASTLLKLVRGKRQSLCHPLISELYTYIVSILSFRTGIG